MCSPYVCEKHSSIVIKKIGKTLPRYVTLVAIKPHMAQNISFDVKNLDKAI